MEVKVLSGIISKQKVFVLAQFVTLISVAVVAPIFHQQIITGSIVNAVLFISVVLLGTQGAILVGLIPSIIALSVGLLSPMLAPMIPFIMLSNALLILVFGFLFTPLNAAKQQSSTQSVECFDYLTGRTKNFWLGIICASFVKFIFLFATSSMVVNLFMKKEIAEKVAMMMSWPQLLTALAGGVIAYLVLKSIKCSRSI